MNFCFLHYSHYLILISIFFKLTKYRITKVLQGCSTVFYYANVLSILSKKCFPTKSTSNNVKKKFLSDVNLVHFPSTHLICSINIDRIIALKFKIKTIYSVFTLIIYMNTS